MSLDIYFKPIQKLEIKNNSIGSFCEFYNVNFPEWEHADVVVVSVEQNHSLPRHCRKGSSRKRYTNCLTRRNG